jgi:hypothetical protein
MWFFSSKSGSETPVRPVLIEALEDRTLMSAVIHKAVKPVAKAAATHQVIVAKAAVEQKQAITAEKKAAAAAKQAAKQEAAAEKQGALAAKKAAQQAALAAKKAALAAQKAAQVAAAKPKAVKAPVTAPQSEIRSYITSAAPSVIGQWTGTMTPDGSTIPSAFSVDFAFQRGVSASGTFTFGAILGNQSVVSTMVFSLHHNVRVLVSAPGIQVGITGTLTSNNATLYGRYSFNSPTGWQTGMFILAR